ncbi:LysR family transcriptional regulator [Acinetobacter bereziniae]|jgi:DNA-binding transcriptional LysR family regulator|uniref:LysR family transcriptional regulator n=1 Tax=Acinetobacter TaxID=469 RepID=UPI0012502CD1|nr:MULTISPECIES: LysR family transcriptional regulator [Acinetobacter]MBJ9903404.1 LysR family transcriptional regulator [Acinetobacter bereziniae]MCM8511187.1 LysR family transcriptional regulator [Acinetobacter bereziniae]MCU4599621.1 LysR family transcriptional regulator [Acinetobacter bereziniae]MDR3028190.1 LysR family transcriptional regulator [Acinetobacter sp.]
MKPKKLNQVTDFDIKLLKIFKTVCDCHSFTAAESILGISRSAISLHMSDLENRLGIRLCQRGRAGFALTDEGREVLQYIEMLTASIEDFRAKINQMHNQLKGEFNIGIINNLVTMQSAYITKSLAQLAEENSEVVINISMSTLSDIECRVLDNRLHAGAIPLVSPLSGLDYFHLYQENSFLYCGENHPLFNHTAKINPKDLKQWNTVLPNYAISPEAMKLHQLLNCSATASDREGIAFLILTGKFIGFLPDHYARKWVVDGFMKPIMQNVMHYSTPICLITHKGKNVNIILKTFMDILKRIVPPIQ